MPKPPRFGRDSTCYDSKLARNMMATARLRSQMMGLTDAAANRIKSVMANAGRPIVGPWRQSRCQEVDIP